MEYVKNCENCGKAFQASRSDARFCSATCRTMANKKTRQGIRKESTSENRETDPLRSESDRSFQPAISQKADAPFLSDVLSRLMKIEDILKQKEDIFFSPVQACTFLSVSRSTLDRYIKDGLLKTYYLRGKESKTKKKIYIKKADVLSLFQEND